jgi:hypothetical protein
MLIEDVDIYPSSSLAVRTAAFSLMCDSIGAVTGSGCALGHARCGVHVHADRPTTWLRAWC